MKELLRAAPKLSDLFSCLLFLSFAMAASPHV